MGCSVFHLCCPPFGSGACDMLPVCGGGWPINQIDASSNGAPVSNKIRKGQLWTVTTVRANPYGTLGPMSSQAAKRYM